MDQKCEFYPTNLMLASNMYMTVLGISKGTFEGSNPPFPKGNEQIAIVLN